MTPTATGAFSLDPASWRAELAAAMPDTVRVVAVSGYGPRGLVTFGLARDTPEHPWMHEVPAMAEESLVPCPRSEDYPDDYWGFHAAEAAWEDAIYADREDDMASSDTVIAVPLDGWHSGDGRWHSMDDGWDGWDS